MRRPLLALVFLLLACRIYEPTEAPTNTNIPPPQTWRVVGLSWEPHPINEDGTPLEDLAGYEVRYGPDAAQLLIPIPIPLVDVTPDPFDLARVHALIELPPGFYYVALVAIDSTGNESALSNIVKVDIRSPESPGVPRSLDGS